ncbi:MAG: tsaB [Crocinitomicaceae bacterium]|jgi:tRNA threonylcarbamoyladenosine biosynthesis protein TsaB|nr:tsaB [Crocinitomicaceae bacterium]
MSYILHLETATKSCSAALSKDGKLVQIEESLDEQYSHGEKLTVFIQDLLQRENIAPANLAAISLSSGPGSYTGLRIGVSVAKGMCYSLSIPLIAIDSLRCLYELAKLKYESHTIVPMIDARRMEVFCSVFKEGKQVRDIAAEILEENSFKELEPFVICGDAAAKVSLFWEGRDVIFDFEIHSSAAGQVSTAWNKFQKKEFEDLAYFEPFYLKDFEMKTKKK